VKTLVLLLLIALTTVVQGQQTTNIPKPGDDLGNISTTDGKTYTAVKLAKIEPDGISVLDSDGGAKIPFEKLPPDMQQKFGYDSAKAQSYVQIQQYQQQIAYLTEENARLRSELSNYKGALSNAQAKPTSSIAAYHAYLFQTVVSLLRTGRVMGGPYDKMTEDQATAYARQKWTTLSDQEKAAYEKMAEQTGDPIVEAKATAAANPDPAYTQGNGAPPPAVPLPPLTSTVIDPQTGDTAIIVH